MITGEGIIAHGMVYVIEGESCLMSMVTLRDLGCVQEEFPEVGRFSWAVAALRAMTSTGHHGADGGSHGGEVIRQPPGDCDPDSPLPCSCPRRQFTDSTDMHSIPATASNRKGLHQGKIIRRRPSSGSAICCPTATRTAWCSQLTSSTSPRRRSSS